MPPIQASASARWSKMMAAALTKQSLNGGCSWRMTGLPTFPNYRTAPSRAGYARIGLGFCAGFSPAEPPCTRGVRGRGWVVPRARGATMFHPVSSESRFTRNCFFTRSTILVGFVDLHCLQANLVTNISRHGVFGEMNQIVLD